MKKVFSLILAALMLLTLTGCQSGNSAELEAVKVQAQQLDEANAALAAAEKGGEAETVLLAEPEPTAAAAPGQDHYRHQRRNAVP